MSKALFFKDEFEILRELEKYEGIVLSGDSYHHAFNVLRVKNGDEIIVSDARGKHYYCSVDFKRVKNAGQAILQYQYEKLVEEEFICPVHLWQALPKGKKFEEIIEKSVELGVHAIHPFFASRSLYSNDKKKLATKLVRWQGIAKAAASQSRRGIVPVVTELLSYEDMLMCSEVESTSAAVVGTVGSSTVGTGFSSNAGTVDSSTVGTGFTSKAGTSPTVEAKSCRQLKLFFATEETEKRLLKDIIKDELEAGLGKIDRIDIVVGPEGGFTVEELRQAEAKNFKLSSLGSYILRTETAAPAVLAMLNVLITGKMV